MSNGIPANTQYGGGGAGGSIYITSNKLRGYSGIISATGGNGAKGGGGGSGGRIKLFNF